jgi:DNA-binding transcriptional LysR family regulator
VEAGSFSAAAEQMQLTTPQISRLLTELEKRLQTKLLLRTTRRQALTDAGADYLERCREILARVDEAEANASGNAMTPHGRLRVQCMTNFGQHYLSSQLADFCALHPQIRLEYSTSQYAPDLLAKGVDVSIYLTENLADSGLIARRLGTTFAVLCASPQYLQAHPAPGTPEALRDHACLQLVNPSITPYWELTDGVIAPRRLAIEPRLVADTPEVLLDAALHGAGITLLPLYSVIDAIRADRLRRVLPQWRSRDIGVHALWPSRQFLDARTRAWLVFVEERVSPRLKEDAAYFS